ncbi:MAG: TIGR04255 family protein [Myxococcales bacterium]|nr:TIGR04255 family protein [Myxococcales bacterium]
MAHGPDYPNQQLRAVSLETFFQGRFAVFSRLEQVQARHSGRLPHLFVPSSREGEAPALRPYHLKSEDQRESLAVAINQATYVSFDYPGYPVFVERALELIGSSLDIFGVNELTRVVYRYDNELAVSREKNSSLVLSDILKFSLPDGSTADVQSVDLQWSRPWPSGVLGGRVWTEQDKQGVEILKLSIFAGVQPGRSLGELAQTAAASHEAARATFESMITDKFRLFLQGKLEEDADGSGGA